MVNVFSDINILVIGDLMLDCYEYGQSIRISEEAPVPIVHLDRSKKQYAAGGAANTAMNISSLGAKCSLIGRIGKDDNGDLLRKIITDSGIFLISVDDGKNPTTTKTRIVYQHQQMIRLDEEVISDLSDINLEKLKYNISQKIFDSDAIVISDYAKGFCTRGLCEFVIREAIKNNKKVFVDPKGSDWSKYNEAFLLAPNLKELSQAVKECVSNDDEEVSRWGKRAYYSIDMEYLLVTRSEKGATLINLDIEHHLPSKAQEVCDVSGAGDTLIAVLAACITKGDDIRVSVDTAIKACAIVIAKKGTVPITYEELLEQ
jgi:rfaE bifunctional protein kinase chain/domain